MRPPMEVSRPEVGLSRGLSRVADRLGLQLLTAVGSMTQQEISMTLTHDTAPTPSDTIEADGPKPVAKRRTPVRKILTATAIFVAGTVAGVAIVDTSGPASSDRTTQPAARSRDDLVRGLVNEGVVPAATLEPGPSPTREDLIRALVNRGVVPAATLEPAAPSREELVRDLVARGLVPAATLD